MPRLVIDSQTGVYRSCEHQTHTRTKRADYLVLTDEKPQRIVGATCGAHMRETVEAGMDALLGARIDAIKEARA